jgi:hypothetical protein
MKPAVSIIPEPDRSTEGRAVSRAMKERVRREQGGICARSWCEAPAVDVDHIIPLWNYGKNVRANLEALCPDCHGQKTAAEAKVRAKAKAQGGETGQKARRDRRGGSSIKARPDGGFPPKGSRPLRSRGFASGRKGGGA